MTSPSSTHHSPCLSLSTCAWNKKVLATSTIFFEIERSSFPAAGTPPVGVSTGSSLSWLSPGFVTGAAGRLFFGCHNDLLAYYVARVTDDLLACHPTRRASITWLGSCAHALRDRGSTAQVLRMLTLLQWPTRTMQRGRKKDSQPIRQVLGQVYVGRRHGDPWNT